jgi:hypothetical protein
VACAAPDRETARQLSVDVFFFFFFFFFFFHSFPFTLTTLQGRVGFPTYRLQKERNEQ